MRLLKVSLSIVILCMMGCDAPDEYASQIDYAKDERTGLCFAMWSMGGNGSTMSNVPCTGAVETQIALTKAKYSKRK